MHYFNTNEILADPSIEIKLQSILEHYDHMIEHYGEEAGVRMARKHVGWYSAGLPSSAEFRFKVNQLDKAEEIKKHIVDFFTR